MYSHNPRLIAVISYITWIGWIAAVVLHNKGDRYEETHINQALVINILRIIGGLVIMVPALGHTLSGIVGAAVLVFWILGLYRAWNYRTDPIPYIGELHLMY